MSQSAVLRDSCTCFTGRLVLDSQRSVQPGFYMCMPAYQLVPNFTKRLICGLICGYMFSWFSNTGVITRAVNRAAGTAHRTL